MKQVFSFKTLLLSALALSLLSFTRHNGITSLCKHIEGKWRVTSYLEDGEEQMGEEFERVTMEFSGSDCEGEFLFTILFGTGDDDEDEDEDMDEAGGTYSIDEDRGKIRLKAYGDDAQTFNLKIKGKELEMSGHVDGSRIVMKAKRR